MIIAIIISLLLYQALYIKSVVLFFKTNYNYHLKHAFMLFLGCF